MVATAAQADDELVWLIRQLLNNAEKDPRSRSKRFGGFGFGGRGWKGGRWPGGRWPRADGGTGTFLEWLYDLSNRWVHVMGTHRVSLFPYSSIADHAPCVDQLPGRGSGLAGSLCVFLSGWARSLGSGENPQRHHGVSRLYQPGDQHRSDAYSRVGPFRVLPLPRVLSSSAPPSRSLFSLLFMLCSFVHPRILAGTPLLLGLLAFGHLQPTFYVLHLRRLHRPLPDSHQASGRCTQLESPHQ